MLEGRMGPRSCFQIRSGKRTEYKIETLQKIAKALGKKVVIKRE